MIIPDLRKKVGKLSWEHLLHFDEFFMTKISSRKLLISKEHIRCQKYCEKANITLISKILAVLASKQRKRKFYFKKLQENQNLKKCCESLPTFLLSTG